jgi:ABC-2 type transport system ATP-binding protein
MPEYAIETAALRREFGRNVAVQGLSLAVPRGEVFGFLGPNGAGKTTSMKLLLGLVAPTSGSGTVLGAPLGDTKARARMGFLPEHFRFHDCLNAREFLYFHGRLLGLPTRGLDTRIEALLLRVGLDDAAHRPLRTYSKGMTQRAGLAQALLGQPELVFLDEPTSGLDPLGRLLVRDVIEELRANGATVFLNSHLLGEVEATCDRVVFVKHGEVVHELELSKAQGTLDVELRVGRVDDALLEGLAAFGTDVRRGADTLVRLHAHAENVLPELARWLVARGVALYELRCRRKSLEEWFVEVMGDDQRPG